jgi:hypothetical protein
MRRRPSPRRLTSSRAGIPLLVATRRPSAIALGAPVSRLLWLVTVFGATGGTGLQVVEQALPNGHEVRAAVRDAMRLGSGRDGLEVVVADVMDSSAIVEAVTGSDTVISTMGSCAGWAPTTVCADSSRSVVGAMHRAGTRRLVVVSGGPIDEGEGRSCASSSSRWAGGSLSTYLPTSSPWRRSCGPAGWTGRSCDHPSSPTKPFTGRNRTRCDLNLHRNFMGQGALGRSA